MKKHGLTIFLALMLGLAVTSAGADEATAEKGKNLFSEPTLGGSTTPASCNDCHPGGKNLEMAGEKPNLKSMINTCIRQALKGQPLEEQSVEMESLVLYIRSLGK